MKIAIITRHGIINYGSFLQTLAMQEVLNSLGHECTVIDYIRNDEHYLQLEKTLLKHNDSWNKNIIRKVIYYLSHQPSTVIAGRYFESIRQKYLNLTRRYSNKEDFYNYPVKADVYITGSDQVWGPVANGKVDGIYTLSFAKGPKLSYAASFGRENIDCETMSFFKKKLSAYSEITVREESAVSLLEKIGISSKSVLDPTLLLGASYWKKFIKPIKNKRYVLIYQLHDSKILGEYAKKVAEEKSVQLVRISTSMHQFVRPGSFRWCPEVWEFLSYIKNADMLITDSFHGTVFSLIFNTQFVDVLPTNNTGTRISNILSRFGLSDRVLSESNSKELLHSTIDFAPVNDKLAKCRNESIEILKKMLDGVIV